jgi:indole-3-glycerol phosphate synthase
MTILDELAAYARVRVEESEKKIPATEMRAQAEAMDNDTGFPFEKAVAAPGVSFICEVKKASPSKGLIAPDFPYLQIAKDYEEAGASAISCLTEPKWFLGSNRYLKEITDEVKIPVLRKDFTVDPYMIWQAKTLGASAVLLICAILSEGQLEEYRQIAEELGMSAIVEAHDAGEIQTAVRSGAKIIGVNNRNLKDFSVDIRNAENLRDNVPEGTFFISESGIRTADDVAALYRNGTDAVLIGETLMRAADKKAKLQELKSGIV